MINDSIESRQRADARGNDDEKQSQEGQAHEEGGPGQEGPRPSGPTRKPRWSS